MSAQLRQHDVARTQTFRESFSPLPKRNARPQRSGRWRVALGLSMLMLCGVVGLGTSAAMRQTSSDLKLIREQTSGNRVALTTAAVERRLGFVTVTGTVTNHSRRSLPHVEAVVELLDEAGRTVGLESALLAFDTLRAGEQAPFRVEMQDQAHASGYRVHFRQLLGPAVD